MDTSDLQQRIQDHYEDPYHRGRCDFPSHVGELQAVCPQGGHDVVAVELRIDDEGLVSEIWFDGGGCTLSQAIASMLAEKLEGQRTEDVTALSFEDAMAQINADVNTLCPSCCRVGFDAIQQAVSSDPIDSEDSPTFGGPDLGDEC